MQKRTFFALVLPALLFTAGLIRAQGSGGRLEDQSKQLEERARKISAQVEARFSGPEWQAKMKQIEETAARINDLVNSPEWHAQLQQIDELSKKIDAEVRAKFEGPEWQEHVRQISESAAKASRGAAGNAEQAAEWKKEMEQLHEATRQIQEEVRRYFDSPEWKEQLRQLREAARKPGENR